MPRVSVIIPAYNQEKFITETIESVLNQTYKDFEILVVDDGSTDSTKQKLEKFGSRIKLIEQTHMERAVARNNGVKNSQGRYIAFVDSDDIWTKDKLQKQINTLDKMKEYILVYSACGRIDEHSKKLKPAQRQLKGYSGNVFENLLVRNFIVSATPLIRREYVLRTEGFNSKYIPYEDWEFWIRLSSYGKFYFIPEPLAYYRIHKSQSVRQVRAEKIEEVTTLLLQDSFNLQNIENKIKNKSLAIANLRFCYWYLINRNKDKAEEKIRKAIELYPDFIFDPRWHGLKLLCLFPNLVGKGIFNLRQYH